MRFMSNGLPLIVRPPPPLPEPIIHPMPMLRTTRRWRTALLASGRVRDDSKVGTAALARACPNGRGSNRSLVVGPAAPVLPAPRPIVPLPPPYELLESAADTHEAIRRHPSEPPPLIH